MLLLSPSFSGLGNELGTEIVLLGERDNTKGISRWTKQKEIIQDRLRWIGGGLNRDRIEDKREAVKHGEFFAINLQVSTKEVYLNKIMSKSQVLTVPPPPSPPSPFMFLLGDKISSAPRTKLLFPSIHCLKHTAITLLMTVGTVRSQLS
jgi:hypothetical protein